jgi:broad specificity phosphatase PhoE
LSDRGRVQVEQLAGRMAGREQTLLVTSDLGRTRTTGAAIGDGEAVADWREFDLGAWDGMRPEEIRRRYPDLESERFGSGDFQPEGGERFSEFTERVRGAFDAVVDRIDDGERATVVTHGGVIQTIVGSIVGAADQSAMLVPSNASLTTIRIVDDHNDVSAYNDDLHLLGDAARPSGTRLRLIRHGQTEANLEHRWWGRGETPLTEAGRRQAAALADVGTSFDAIVSSPSSRARETAAAAAARNGATLQVMDDLAELHFGEWEGLTGPEAKAADPDAFRRIFEEGLDEPRGTTGESFAAAGNRFGEAATAIAANGSGLVGVFTHGGVTRAYIAGLLGIPFEKRDVLPIQRNTAHSEIIYGGSGPRISSYNVAAHLGD